MLPDMLQKLPGIGILPSLVRIWKPLTNIALRRCSQDGVRHSVEQDVSITVSIQPKVAFNSDSPQNQRSPFDRSVEIMPFSNAKNRHFWPVVHLISHFHSRQEWDCIADLLRAASWQFTDVDRCPRGF